MEKKQTAVEWLVDNAEDFFGNLLAPSIIEQAKEMEKEQMFDYIKKNYVNGEHSLKFHKEEFEQYYNETYGTNSN